MVLEQKSNLWSTNNFWKKDQGSLKKKKNGSMN